MVLVGSEDYGRDEQTAQVNCLFFVVVSWIQIPTFGDIDRSLFQSLLQRHAHVHDEIEAFKSDMKKLDEQSQLMNETSQSKKNENKQVNIGFLW